MDRVDAFRKALVAVIQDPEFVADAKRASADLSLVTGEELQALTDRLFTTAPDVLKRARALLSD
jgi:tripartite-type tricarboxylate transporter receptor subunit TctC